jgi:hypothetical protein
MQCTYSVAQFLAGLRISCRIKLTCKLQLQAPAIIALISQLSNHAKDTGRKQSSDSRKIAENPKGDVTAATGGTWSKVGSSCGDGWGSAFTHPCS